MLTALVALSFLAAPDIGVDSIIQPRGMISGGWWTRPCILVSNCGDSASGFRAWLTVLSRDSVVYVDSVNVPALGPTVDTTLWFTDLNPEVLLTGAGNVARCSVFCAGDTNLSNDTLSTTFGVWPSI